MPQRYSEIAEKLKPWIIKYAQQVQGGAGQAGGLGESVPETGGLSKHDIVGFYHTGTGTEYQLVGFTGANVLGIRSPSSCPTSREVLMADDNGQLQLTGIGLGMAPDTATPLQIKSTAASTRIIQIQNSGGGSILEFNEKPTGGACGVLNILGDISASGAITASGAVTTTGGIANYSTYSGSGAANFYSTVNVADDFVVGGGVGILFVDVSGSRVGVNCAPDAQFDLDVYGNFRCQGWIVGKHAIQLDGALAIFHYEGREPYETDYSGDFASHFGHQPSTVSGGVIFRPGKFGKAVQVGESTTNLVINSSFEHPTSASYGWTKSASLESAASTARYSFSGSVSMCLSESSALGTGEYISGPTGDYIAVSSGSYTLSAHIKKDVSSASCTGDMRILWYDSTPTFLEYTILTLDAGDHDWKRYSITGSIPATATQIKYMVNLSPIGAGESGSIWVDAVQFENKEYATPYCDGTLGAMWYPSGETGAVWVDGKGHEWSGVGGISGEPHETSSSRPNSYLVYDYDSLANIVNPDKGTLMTWIKWPINLDGTVNNATSWNDYLVLQFDNVNDAVRIETYATNQRVHIWSSDSASNALSYPWSASAETWYHVATTWDRDNDIRIHYLNGASVASDTFSGFGATSDGYMRLGHPSDPASASTAHGGALIDEVVLVDRAITSDELRSIYESNAPVFAESSTFSFRSGKNLVWADEEGLWMRDTNGDAVMGFSGVNSKSWGGFTLNAGDIAFGTYGAGHGGWFNFDRDGVSSSPYLRLGYANSTIFEFDTGGATINGVLDIDTTGGIYQGTGTFSSPSTGMKMWNSSGKGRIAGYNSGASQAGLDTSGRIVAGQENVVMDNDGFWLNAETSESYTRTKSLNFITNGSVVGTVFGWHNGTTVGGIHVEGASITGDTNSVVLVGRGNGAVRLQSESGGALDSEVLVSDNVYLTGAVILTNSDLYAQYGDIYSTALTSVCPAETGWSADINRVCHYKKVGKTVHFWWSVIGTSDSASSDITLPYTNDLGQTLYVICRSRDNGGAWQAGLGAMSNNSKVLRLFPDVIASGWTSSGSKGSLGYACYESDD